MDERTHARYMSDIAYFLSKMEAEPNSGYFIPIALAYNKLEKYDETIAMCKTAVERFPSNCAAKTFLAEAYVYKGLFDQARDLLFDVTAEDDNNYKALKLLGIICKEKGDNTEALKYLTGAFIRSPEDEEVRKMIDELGGTLNPSEIYDERMKRQSQNAAESEEDEDLKTYKEIDKRIRSAEIIMADLVSDTSINARNYEEEEDFHSDNPNDYMPLITQHEAEEEEEESLAGNPDDFLPLITKQEEIKESEELKQDLTSNKPQEDTAESNNQDDLLSALTNEEAGADNDLAAALQEENISEENAEEAGKEDNIQDDLLSALTNEEEGSANDLAAALQEENISEENAEEAGKEDNIQDDLLSALTNEEAGSDNDLAAALQEENISEENAEETGKEDNIQDDLLSALTDEEEGSDNDLAEAIQEEDISPENMDIEDSSMLSKEDFNDDKEVSAQDESDESKDKEMFNKQVPSSFDGMTYDDMIDDDFQYGKIVDESYKDMENPSIDLGESAPFTQGDIMEEILSAVGMTHDDMADDERINETEKDRKLMRLENLLEKVQHNKENI